MPTSAKIFSAIVLSLITCVAQVASAASAKDRAFLGITGMVYPITGTLTGLNGGELALTNNYTDELIISDNGVFRFHKEIAAGNPYNVAVSFRPFGQVCRVLNGEGIANGPVSNIAVVCEENNGNRYVGGTVAGLSTDGLVLMLNGTESLAVTNDGSYEFLTKMTSGSPYQVSISQQPNGQSCDVNFGTGTIGKNNVYVNVQCK